jgi:hypothetical protein
MPRKTDVVPPKTSVRNQKPDVIPALHDVRLEKTDVIPDEKGVMARRTGVMLEKNVSVLGGNDCGFAKYRGFLPFFGSAGLGRWS